MTNKFRAGIAALFMTTALAASRSNATTLDEFEAMTPSQGANFIASLADKAANVVHDKDPVGEKAIRDYFTKPAQDTGEIPGVIMYVVAEGRARVIDAERKAKNPNAVLLADDPDMAEKVLATVTRKDLSIPLVVVDHKFVLNGNVAISSSGSKAPTTQPAGAATPVTVSAVPAPVSVATLNPQ